MHQKHCISGKHNLTTDGGYYFFCDERTLTKYIELRQYDDDILEIQQVFAYEETKRKCSRIFF